MEDDDAGQARGIGQAVDRVAFLVGAGVAAGGHDDADAGAVLPAHVVVAQHAVRTGIERGQQVALPARQDDLRFGIAEAAVEFEHLRSVAGQHETRVEHAAIGDAAFAQLAQRRFKHGGADHRPERVGHDRRGRIGAHAAGVRALVAVEDALVVLRGGEHDDVVAVSEGEDGRLLAVEEFLHEHARAGGAERAAHHRLIDRVFRLVQRLADQHALARGEAVGLDDKRRAQRACISAGRAGLGKRGGLRGGHAGLHHHVLGEHLAAFELRGGLGRPEHAQARGEQAVGQPRAQRRLGPDHGEIRAVFDRPRDQRLDIGRGDGQVPGHLRGTRVARRADEPGLARVMRQFPRDGVFAAAAADDKDQRIVHGSR